MRLTLYEVVQYEGFVRRVVTESCKRKYVGVRKLLLAFAGKSTRFTRSGLLLRCVIREIAVVDFEEATCIAHRIQLLTSGYNMHVRKTAPTIMAPWMNPRRVLHSTWRRQPTLYFPPTIPSFGDDTDRIEDLNPCLSSLQVPSSINSRNRP
jgi:hypothetical protein